MQQNKLFQKTRFQLAAWYAIGIGLVLSICSVAVYQGVVVLHRRNLHQKLESLVGVLHDGIEPVLEKPGNLPPIAQQIVPGLCQSGRICSQLKDASGRHIAAVFAQKDYYVRFLERSGTTIATAGKTPNLSSDLSVWQTLKDQQGNRYYQVSWALRTQAGETWGYVQIGRSLQEFDQFLFNIQLLLLLGLPFAMLLIGGASWWLAGLAMRPLAQSYQNMQQFTSDVAHELRTPLTVLLSTIEETRLCEALPEIDHNLSLLERQTLRLAELVKDLLFIARLEQKPDLSTFQYCCLNDVIQDLVEELSSLARTAKITLVMQLTHLDLVILGNMAQLYRLVSNLMTNAIRYTPAGGTVKLSLESTSHDALIHIQDTGIGIAPKEQSRIFDRFYRVNSDRSRATGGSGLGLSIASAIAIAHHGCIQVQSEIEKGSTFTIQLPLKL